ncbi:MAG: hypothetical protein PHY02_09505 [Phycisphaerae bacterium]|nr:hypothetical protein [Phycisphaerae bacterium]
MKRISKSRAYLRKTRKGMALIIALILACIITILGFSVLSVANSEVLLTQNTVKQTKAFYLAEAGMAIFSARLQAGQLEDIGETTLGEGTYRLDYYADADPPYAIATGTVAGQQKSVRVDVAFLAPPYECGIYAGGFGGDGWTFMLRGEGNPNRDGIGGKDTIYGNIFVNGDAALYEESSIKPAPWPNDYGLNGDIEATGDVSIFDRASVSGGVAESADPQPSPDLVGMNYSVNNTHNVSKIFTDAGVSRGTLPQSSELRDVFIKNPSDRNDECDTTAGDDFFFEPSSGFKTGGPGTGDTPLNAGVDRVYYVDGDVWVHSKPTYGFKMEGKATIVATGNIHICDNLEYKDNNRDMLGIVALGKYNSSGQLVSGGNIYFGDPGYGNMAVFSAMMFAANDFLYNTDPIGKKLMLPDSGFTIKGNLSALNNVSIERDWYEKVSYSRWGRSSSSEYRPAVYNPKTRKWVDSETGENLSSTETRSIKHYQMKIEYDDRVRTQATQPPGLPRGAGSIFAGLTDWQEVSSN